MPKFKFLRTVFFADQNIGLHSMATDSYCLLGIEPRKDIFENIRKILKVDMHITSMAATNFVGIFSAGNKNGIILPKIMEKHELKRMKELGINVAVIGSKDTAMGNLILCNDKGVLISPRLEDHKKEIEECLGVEGETGTIAGLDIIGSAGVASNRGCLCHREATENELERIEEILKVKADVGTISFGSPFVKAGTIVNSNGLVVSQISTGPELGRAFEVFGEA